jgi:hypothetical protein
LRKILLMSEKMISMLLNLLIACLAFFGLDEVGLSWSNTCVQVMLAPWNTCLIITTFSVAFFPRYAQNLMRTHRWLCCEMTSARCTTPNKSV